MRELVKGVPNETVRLLLDVIILESSDSSESFAVQIHLTTALLKTSAS